jgi:hypothetical protein
MVEERLPVKELSLNHLFKKGLNVFFVFYFGGLECFGYSLVYVSYPVMIFEVCLS